MRDAGFKLALLAIAIIAFALSLSTLAAAQLTAQQSAGKQLYLEGTSPSGKPFEAILSDGSTHVPARLMPCGSCHGADGRGRPEGGVVPSDITWDSLTRPYRSEAALGRNRPAYTAYSLRRAITLAVDSSGHRLGVTMPRYRISPRDLGNLVEYLKLLDHEPEPGLTADTIRVGAILPTYAASAPDNIGAVLQAYFDELSRQGGIYNRKIELVSLAASGTPAEVAAQARKFAHEKNIFAMLAPLSPGADREFAEFLDQFEVPTVVT